MDTDLERPKNTTILFPPDLFDQLTVLAAKQKSSASEERLAAVAALSALNLPVGSPEEMERESTPPTESCRSHQYRSDG